MTIPAEERNPRETLLRLLRGAQAPPAGLLNAPPPELRAFLKDAFEACLADGPRGNAARGALRKIISGFQELSTAIRDGKGG